MLRDPYFALAPRSVRAIGWEDLAATLTQLSACSVAAAVQSHDVAELLVSGGGTRNPELMRRLRDVLPQATVADADSRGVDPDAKEVLMWALLGFLSWHGLPGTVIGQDGRTATGASGPRVLGRLTPGARPLRMPDPSSTPVRSLRLV
ncbi:MAG: anhydro-N-acetylmuramic acid kinase [Nocardioidaceae bacterium]